MNTWIMTIDVERCENCNNCFLSCKDEHYDNDWPPYTLAQPRHGHRWMNIFSKEHGRFPYIGVAYMPRPCLHCPDPPCVNAAPNGEIYKRPDGIVIVDPERSAGRKDLAGVCPHGAIWWNRENRTPQKCTLCAHLLDAGWQQPRCAQACPTGALTFRSIPKDKLGAYIRANRLQAADGSEPAPAAPLVLYKNLGLFNGCAIAGSVATGKNGVQDCVEGAMVELLRDGASIAGDTTDAFGDFRFSGLSPDIRRYDLKVIHMGKEVCRRPVDLGVSSIVGTVWI